MGILILYKVNKYSLLGGVLNGENFQIIDTTNKTFLKLLKGELRI